MHAMHVLSKFVTHSQSKSLNQSIADGLEIFNRDVKKKCWWDKNRLVQAQLEKNERNLEKTLNGIIYSNSHFKANTFHGGHYDDNDNDSDDDDEFETVILKTQTNYRF